MSEDVLPPIFTVYGILMIILGVNYSTLKGLERLSTASEGLVSQHIPEQERIDVVGSALRKPLSQGQPVNLKYVDDSDIVIADARGTIHLRPRRVQCSLPLDPAQNNYFHSYLQTRYSNRVHLSGYERYIFDIYEEIWQK